MARLRPPPVRALEGTVTVRSQPKPHGFKKGHQKLGGRPPGQGNLIPGSVREAITRGLAMYGRDASGRTDIDGLSAFVYKCAQADLELGARLLMCIAPRAVDAVVRHEPVLLTLEDVDRSLVANGLPPSSEIFKIDYTGSVVADEDLPEAEVVDIRDSSPK